jgi:alpha-mannosidase
MKSVIAAVAGLAVSMSAFAQGEKAAEQPRKVAAQVPVIPDLTKPTLFVVAYAHLDTQWRWAYPQTIREFIANTLHQNFALFEKYPSYIFNFSGSRRYEMMEEYFPAEFEQLKKYVAAGRWFPCGSSVDENDANVPSAESLVRHVLYGNHYFQKKFGVTSQEYMLPDCFGFPAALPQVLAHCGIKGFSTQKLTWNACVPIPFKVGVWEGPDGSSVVAALDPGAYVGEVKEDLSSSNAWLNRIENNGRKSGVYADYHYYGTGDQGGAPKDASVNMVERSANGTGPVKIIPSKADELFKAITPEMKAKLPTYKGELELTQHSAGSVTSEAYMKRWNRKNELLADAAERAAVAAAWLGGREYPAKKLEDAWYLLLGSQMHDILPGTSLPKAYDFSWNDEVLAGNLFSSVLEDSAGVVISGMDTSGGPQCVVVYNPTSLDREDLVVASVPVGGGAASAAVVTGPDGKVVASQVLGTSEGMAKVAFVAKTPQVGFAAYGVTFNTRPAPGESSLKVSERSMENEYYTVKLDDNGDVSSIFDKKAKHEMLSGPAKLGLHYENPSQWPAWNQDWEDRVKPAKGYVNGPASFKVVENGPARVAVEVTRKTEGSTFTQTISLSWGVARVEFDNDILWNSRERSLRAAFPLAVSNPKATYDVQAGTIERPNSHKEQFEYGFHQWMDLTDSKGDYGVTVMCDSKYGSDKPDDHTMRITLLHTPGTRGGYQDQGSQDLGHHHVKFAVYGHAGPWQKAEGAQQALRFNQPLIPFISTAHPGPLGKTFSLMQTSDPSVFITAIKKAEDSDELVVRLREIPGTGAKGVKVSMAKPIAAAREVDGQERQIGKGEVEGGALVTDVHGFGLRAFAIKPGESSTKVAKLSGTAIPLPFDVDVVSSNKNRKDGDFDGKGNSIPAEQLPHTILAEGVEFDIGSTEEGRKNALACNGQEIKLPEGTDRVYLLAAADEDVSATISIDGQKQPWKVQSWGGYIGQWDHRLWKGDTPESAYSWANDIAGLEPGFIKNDSVAWFCSHHHTAAGDAYYEYSYLFKYPIDLKPGAKSITLPENRRIKVLAATAVKFGSARSMAAAPLFDTLPVSPEDEPKIVAAPGSHKDSTEVKIEPGLYWRGGAFRYTLDGSDPTAGSPVYMGPIRLSSTATVKVGMLDSKGKMGQIVSTKVDVDDKTPPSVTRIAAVATSPKVLVEFSEPVAGLNPANFTVTPSEGVRLVELSQDKTRAMLTMAAPMEANKTYVFLVSNVSDVAPSHNTLKSATVNVTPAGPVYTLDEVKEPKVVKNVAGLPVKAHDSWTINMFVKTDKQPTNHTIFAGFGACATGKTGAGRYLAKFANGLHFWSDNEDVESNAAVAVNNWQMLTATCEGGTLKLYKNGKQVSEDRVGLTDDESTVNIMPQDPWDHRYQFSGEIRGFTIWNAALGEDSLAALVSGMPK